MVPNLIETNTGIRWGNYWFLTRRNTAIIQRQNNKLNVNKDATSEYIGLINRGIALTIGNDAFFISSFL